jgi:hypothetical protein
MVEGTIKKFDSLNGWGFIEDDEGNDYFFNVSNVRTVSNTNDREYNERNANFNIIGHNAIRTSAMIGRTGHVRHAQANAKTWKRKMAMMAQTTE